MKLILLPALVVFPLICVAQLTPQRVDSLKKELNKHVAPDTIRAEILINLADALTYANPAEALRLADEAIEIVQQDPNGSLVPSAWRQKGNIHGVLTEYTQAIDSYQQAIRAAEAKAPNDRLTYFMAILQNNLGVIYIETGEYDKALISFNKLLSVTRQQKIPHDEAMALLNIGDTYTRKQDFKKAVNSLEKGLVMAQKIGDQQMMANILANIGLAQHSLKQYAQALSTYRKSLFYAEIVGDQRAKLIALGAIGELYHDLNKPNEGEPYARQAYDLAKTLGIRDYQRMLAQTLGYIYIRQSKKDLAMQYLEEAKILHDTLMNADKKTELARQEMRFEQEKRDIKHKAELDEEQLRRNVIIAGAILLLLTFLIIFVFYKSRRDADALREAAEFRAQTAEARTQVAETEAKALRAQISPHFIGNSLTAIAEYIVSNEADRAERYILKFAKLMKLILENSAKEQVALSDDLQALKVYLELENIKAEHPFTYEIVVDENIDPDMTFVPPLLLQPFVENSIVHGIATKANGGHIAINIYKDAQNVIRCTIVDNGVGRAEADRRSKLQPEGKSHGMATAITNQRIINWNRKKNSTGAVIISDLEEGTKVEFQLPF